ncbi:DUF6339 family protein [Saliphagus sp. GCM10025317]
MTELRKLLHQGVSEIDEDFIAGERDVDPDLFERHSTPVDGTDVDYGAIQTKIDEIFVDDDYPQYEAKMDAALAPTIHANIRIDRRTARDERIWYYLAAVKFDDFVRYRWRFDFENNRTAAFEKFLGETTGNNLYTNAIGRLWWLAELTHVDPATAPVDVDDEYELTREVFEFNFLANRILDNAFHMSKPLVIAVVDQFADESQDLVNVMPDRLSTLLSMMPAEGWVEDNSVEVVSRLKRQMKSERA